MESKTKAFNPQWVIADQFYFANNIKSITNGADGNILYHKTDNTALIGNAEGTAIKYIPACGDKIVYKDLNQIWCLHSNYKVYKLVNNAWQEKYAGPYRDISADLSHDGLLFFCNLNDYGISYVWSTTGATGTYPGSCLKIRAINHLKGLFVVGTDNRFYSWNQEHVKWLDFGGWISDVAYAANMGYAAVIGGSGVLYTNDLISTGYRAYTGTVTSITFAFGNRLFGVGLDHRLYEFQTKKITFNGNSTPFYKMVTQDSTMPGEVKFVYPQSDGYAYMESTQGYFICEVNGGASSWEARSNQAPNCLYRIIAVAPNQFCLLNKHTGKYVKEHNDALKMWDTVCWRPNQWNFY